MPLSRALGLSVLLAAAGCTLSAQGARRSLAGCSVLIDRTAELRLRDGSAVSIDASTLAPNSLGLLAAGTPTVVWNIPLKGDYRRPGRKQAIGVIVDNTGGVQLLESPLDIEVKHPRAVAAADSGWHVIFFTGTEGTTGSAIAFDSAAIWYAFHNGIGWAGVRRIGQASHATLQPHLSSALVHTGSKLAFAYSFDGSFARKSNQRGNQGLVLLHESKGDWREDTLPTWEGPRAVQLGVAGRRIEAVFSQGYFDSRGSHPPALFAASFDSAWTRAGLLLEAPSGYLAAPKLPDAARFPINLLWQAATYDQWTEELHWGRLAEDGRVRQRVHTWRVDPSRRHAIVPIDDSLTVVAIVETRVRAKAALVVLLGDEAYDAGAIPNDAPSVLAAPLPDRRFAVLTGRVGDAADDPPASSYLTVGFVRCSGAQARSPA